jgi:hypothetical protein
LLCNKQINESQAKVYFGWVPSSSMLSEYSHLVSQDVNEVMLGIHGIKTSEEEKQEPKIKQCKRCKTINPKDNLFCGNCGGILDVDTAIELDERRYEYDEIIAHTIGKVEKRELKKEEAFDVIVKEVVKRYMERQNK